MRGLIYASLTILIWGVTFVNTRALLNQFSALEIQVLRFALAYVVLWAIHPRRARLPWREEGLFVLLGLTGVAVYQLMENCAIHYTNASNVSILVALNPAITAILARLVNGERRLSPLFLVGFLVAITGVVMVSLNGVSAFHFRPVGDLMALAAMLSWGFYSILVSRVNQLSLSPVVVIRRTFFWALALTLPLVLFGLTPVGGEVMEGSFKVTLDLAANQARFSSALNFVNLGFLGCLASAACFVWWNKSCKMLGVVRCTVGLYLIPAITVVFAYLFLGERLTAVSAAGAVLTVVGVLISGWRR